MFKEYVLNKLKIKIAKELDYKSDYEESIIRINGEDVKNNFSFHNNRCHLNAYDLYCRNNNFKVRVCWCSRKENKSEGFIHFVNMDIDTGDYWDDTLGRSSDFYNYYIFKDSWLDKNIDKNPNSWLRWAKEDLYKKYCTNKLWLFLTRNIELNDLI